MKIVYMGTPDFAVPSLMALHDAGHEILYVVTQPDSASGRGKKVKFSPVKEKAVELGIKVLQPHKISKDVEFINIIRKAAPDIIAVAAYGQLLPKVLLDIPKRGCINVHGSLLPRFRGAAPIQRAIIEGDEETGVTIMYMAEGLDTGDMLAKEATPIDSKTGQQLHDELAVMGAELLVDTIEKLDTIKAEKQDDKLSTYAPMISKKDGQVDFDRKAEEIERCIRAFDPWPGAYTFAGEKVIKLWKGQVIGQKTNQRNGSVIKADSEGMDIATGGEVLRITEIQVPGKKRVEIKEYLKGNSIEIGTVLG